MRQEEKERENYEKKINGSNFNGGGNDVVGFGVWREDGYHG